MTTMPYIRNSLGDGRVSVWTAQQGRRTSDTAIISAHGEAAIINGTFPQGNYSLVYFGPHGYDLEDPGLVKFWEYGVIAHEPPSTFPFSQDYELTKYQGRHNDSGETYDLIRKLLPRILSPDIITVSNERSVWGF